MTGVTTRKYTAEGGKEYEIHTEKGANGGWYWWVSDEDGTDSDYFFNKKNRHAAICEAEDYIEEVLAG